MDKQKEIIEFEDLFKNEKQPKKPNKYKPDRKGTYLTTIFLYFIVMFIVAGLLFIALQNIPGFQQTYTESELIFENIASDIDGIAIISDTTYEEYHEPYDDFVLNIYIYNDYAILVNADNEYYSDMLLITDAETEIVTLNTEALLAIIGDMTVTTWDGQEELINIYAGKNQTLPYFFTADYFEVEGPITKITDFGNSILNFSVYIILLPLIFFMLKVDFIGDFNEFKTIKSQWLPIILIGYVYILLGNVLSNYASTFLGDIFGIAPSEAINQLTIIGGLNSTGAIFMILSAVVMGPVVEELIFRKAMFGLFENGKIALVVSAILFGSIHLIGEASIPAALINGLSYYTMGFIFGYIYLKNNKNIIASISIHILSNLISVIAILFFY